MYCDIQKEGPSCMNDYKIELDLSRYWMTFGKATLCFTPVVYRLYQTGSGLGGLASHQILRGGDSLSLKAAQPPSVLMKNDTLYEVHLSVLNQI